MSLEVLKEDILHKAKIEKEKILNSLKEEISRLESESNLEIDNYRENLELKYQKEKESFMRQILGKADKDAKTIILNAKNKITNNVFEDFELEIKNLTKKERETLLQSLIKKAEKYIKYEVVYCSKSDLAFVKSKVEKECKVLESHVEGLIFKNKSETEILDLRFSEIVESIFDTNNNKIQEVLFK